MKGWLGYPLTILGIIVLWQIGAWLAGPVIVPEPLLVIRRLFAEVGDGTVLPHLWASVWRITVALFISLVTAVPLGLFLGTSRKMDRLTRPLIYLSYPVPKIVFLPLVFLIFGIGEVGKIVMLTLILFFQLLLTARDSAREVGQEMRYSMASLGGKKWDLFVHVILPFSLPGIFTALRVAAGTVVAVLFFVESIGTRFGLGFYILDAWGRADSEQIYVGILLLAAVGVTLYESFDVMERAVCRWKR